MSRPTNALIVDDEAHVRLYLKLILRELGIGSTWEAPDGQQALAQIEAHQPELVLLDVNMPIFNGLEILGHLQQTRPDTPVVMVTSLTSMDTVKRAMELGAMGYIVKHSPRAEVVAQLSEIFAELEAEKESGQS